MVDRSKIYLTHNRILYEQKAVIYTCAYSMGNVFDMLRGEIWITKNLSNIPYFAKHIFR